MSKMYLSKITIRNFCCLDHIELELKPITILFGMNGSGKTTIVSALTLLKQLSGKDIDNSISDLGDYRNIVKDGDTSHWVSIGLEIIFDKNEFLEQITYSDIDKLQNFFNNNLN